MASRAEISGWSAAVFVAAICGFCALPLVAQNGPAMAKLPDIPSPGYTIIRAPLLEVAASPDSWVTSSPVQSAVGIPVTADALIEQMALAAGVIFAGQVTAVRQPVGFAGSGQDAAAGIVEIDFRVDLSSRGPDAGSIYTLREWSGLWTAGSGRYRPGQRLLLFLYAPDAHGLSAPVHGAEGAIPLRGSGIAPDADADSAAGAEWLVDLRWLQAQVLRRDIFKALRVRDPTPPSPVPILVPPGGPSPDHAIVPGQNADRRMIEADPLLVRAIREPWLRPTAAPVETQPLSQVLALCHEAMTLDAMRHRDAVH